MKILRTFLVTMMVIMGSTQSAKADTPTHVNFGIISTETSQNLRDQWEPLLQDMEAHLGIPVKPFFASDYAGVVEAMRFGKVDVAWFGNKSAIEAVDRAGGEVFAQIMPNDGSLGYYALLIAHKDSPLNSVEDLIEKPDELTFSNGDPNSTSGFLIPYYYVFAKNNIDPKTHFKRLTNASHEVNALSVARKKIDVATNNTTILGDPDAANPKAGRLWKSRPKMVEQIKVIWKSPLIPNEPLVYRTELSDSFKTTIREFFYGYGKTEKEQQILADINSGIQKFQPSTNDQLTPIREIVRFHNVLKTKSN